MGATLQSWQHLFSADPLAAGIISLEGSWGVSQVHLTEVEVEVSSSIMLANSLDDLLAVLEALSVHV
jgi:hypothetical protein